MKCCHQELPKVIKIKGVKDLLSFSKYIKKRALELSKKKNDK